MTETTEYRCEDCGCGADTCMCGEECDVCGRIIDADSGWYTELGVMYCGSCAPSYARQEEG